MDFKSKILSWARSLNLYLTFPSPNRYGCYRGIFESNDQALAAIPKSWKVGFDHADLAQEYREQFNYELSLGQYPVLLRLQQLLQEGNTVFDYGGNIGVNFFVYEQYVNYPRHLRWIVGELPALIQEGKKFAKEKNRSEITFTNRFDDANGVEIFLASSSLHYIGELSPKIAQLQYKPKHILINRSPFCEGPSFVTIQNGGIVFYPAYIFNRQQFQQSICDLGYELVDQWFDPSEPVAVPFHPEFLTLCYQGMYFRQR
jgi:putative methyltransferase (TIGR04325 family)